MKLTTMVLTAAAVMMMFGGAPAQARGCVDGTRIFADVPAEHPMCHEIESMFRDGLTNGCRVEEGMRYFCPEDQLTRSAAATFSQHRDPFAQIAIDGRINIGDHVANADRFDEEGPGIYWVQFNRNISHGCSMEGWSHDWHGPNVRVDVTLLWGTIDTVLVKASVNGQPMNMWFNVRIHCR